MNRKVGGVLLIIGGGILLLIMVAAGIAVILRNQINIDSASLPTVDLTADPYPGLLIISVLPGSPAEQAGLRAGQLILQANGADLYLNSDLTNLVEDNRSGTAIQLIIADTDNQLRQAALVKPAEPPFLGIEIRPNSDSAYLSLTPAPTATPASAATTTRLPSTAIKPAEIRGIIDGSPAASADLQVGDIIIAVDGEVVLNGEELSAEIAGRPAGTVVTLTLRRGAETIQKLVILGVNPENPQVSYLGVQLPSP